MNFPTLSLAPILLAQAPTSQVLPSKEEVIINKIEARFDEELGREIRAVARECNLQLGFASPTIKIETTSRPGELKLTPEVSFWGTLRGEGQYEKDLACFNAMKGNDPHSDGYDDTIAQYGHADTTAAKREGYLFMATRHYNTPSLVVDLNDQLLVREGNNYALWGAIHPPAIHEREVYAPERGGFQFSPQSTVVRSGIFRGKEVKGKRQDLELESTNVPEAEGDALIREYKPISQGGEILRVKAAVCGDWTLWEFRWDFAGYTWGYHRFSFIPGREISSNELIVSLKTANKYNADLREDDVLTLKDACREKEKITAERAAEKAKKVR